MNNFVSHPVPLTCNSFSILFNLLASCDWALLCCGKVFLEEYSKTLRLRSEESLFGGSCLTCAESVRDSKLPRPGFRVLRKGCPPFARGESLSQNEANCVGRPKAKGSMSPFIVFLRAAGAEVCHPARCTLLPGAPTRAGNGLWKDNSSIGWYSCVGWTGLKSENYQWHPQNTHKDGISKKMVGAVRFELTTF